MGTNKEENPPRRTEQGETFTAAERRMSYWLSTLQKAESRFKLKGDNFLDYKQFLIK